MPSRETPTPVAPVFDHIRTLLHDVADCDVQLRREDLIIEIFDTVAANVAEITSLPRFAQTICNKLLEWEHHDETSGEGRVFARFKFLLEELQCDDATPCYKN